MKKFFRNVRFWWRSIRNPDDGQTQAEPARIILPKPIVVKPDTPTALSFTDVDKRKRSNVYYEAMYSMMMIKEAHKPAIEKVVTRIKRNKARYQNAELLTGVDWRIIGAIHNLEASGRFTRQLLNGQRWNKRTTIVPKRQGPWKSWEQSCISAFKYHPLKAHDIATVSRFFERYNGTGYVKRGLNSPYLYSFTNWYSEGKYVSDGKFDASAVSEQVGALVVLKELGYLK